MTKAFYPPCPGFKILRNSSFQRFCLVEYGYTLDDLKNFDLNLLVEVYQRWIHHRCFYDVPDKLFLVHIVEPLHP